jgi:hypothetical protein
MSVTCCNEAGIEVYQNILTSIENLLDTGKYRQKSGLRSRSIRTYPYVGGFGISESLPSPDPRTAALRRIDEAPDHVMRRHQRLLRVLGALICCEGVVSPRNRYLAWIKDIAGRRAAAGSTSRYSGRMSERVASE